MDKHAVAYPNSQKLNSNENKETTATLSIMAGFHKVWSKRSQTQEHIVYDCTYSNRKECKLPICGDKSLDSSRYP